MATPYFKTKSFKTLKNLLFGVGAAVVIVGAWAKILHLPFANIMLTVGLLTEAIIFTISGIVPPEPDYYWENIIQVWINMMQKHPQQQHQPLQQVIKNLYQQKWIKCQKQPKQIKIQ